ncbi:outer membrane beta-barrel protein [Ferruginibacter sp. SUN002]|uniref:outer membrane beta-barrel protein n=1 Tax=Ferruginibacter sp. SUN002 TaxID=2937789 RepID=UPI003D35F9CB
MRKIILYILCMSGIAYTNAQKISGIVLSNDSLALSNSSVSLLDGSGKKLVKLHISNDEGKFLFTEVKPGTYLINISHVDYKGFTSKIINVVENTDIEIPIIRLQKISGTLSEIIVKYQRPMIEVQADKLVLNVDGTINATGTDALELIRKSPGVSVDKDDNIQMIGKSGVQIFIDDKPSPLNGEELGNYLKSIQSSQIELIELITNPSAKYEAAGNGGIINIKLKKNKSVGTNGTITAGYGVGVYGKYNAGVSLNHRNKKINIFGNYNFNHALNYIDFRIKRMQLDSLFDFVSDRNIKNTTHGFKAGIDFFASPKNTFGFFVSGNLVNLNPKSLSITPISYMPTHEVAKVLVSDNVQEGFSNNINLNGNYKFSGRKQNHLNVDVDYGFFDITRNLYQPNIYYKSDTTTELSRAIYRFPSRADIDIYSVKMDYEHPFEQGILAYGIKSSFVKSDNNFRRYNVLGNTESLDTYKSNQFNYKEYINAAYMSFNRNMQYIQLQLGVRVEHTVSKGESYPINGVGIVQYNSKESFTRRYTNLFPSVSISFVKNPEMIWGITAGRRVDRPNYHDLNPFEFKLDEYTFRKGNTELVPQFSSSISISNTYKSKLISKLGYSYIKDLLGLLVDTIDVSKNFITPKNIAEQKIITLSENYQLHKDWYTGFFNFNAFYSTFNADFGGGDRVVNTEIFSVITGVQNSFKLGKNWMAELSATYNSPTLSGILKSKSRWGMDVGAQKSIMKGMGNLKFAVTDIFWSNVDRGSLMFAGQESRSYFRRESRQFKINFTYRFGNKQVKSARNRSSGSEDELKRSENTGS